MKLPHKEVALGRAFINLRPEITAAILSTLQAGWQLACLRVEVNTVAAEVVITECLRDSMRDVLQKLPWQTTMVILPGTESRSTKGILIPDGRTDIPIFVIPVFDEFREHDPHAIIECKRLSAHDAHLVREYVTAGIDRFVAGKYAASHAQGFMAAYIIAGDTPAAVEAINTFLTKNGRPTERLRPTDVIDASWVRVSDHARPSQTQIQLHHSFLLVA